MKFITPVLVAALLSLSFTASAECLRSDGPPDCETTDQVLLSKTLKMVERSQPRLPSDEVDLPWVWTQIRTIVSAAEDGLPNHKEKDLLIQVGPAIVSNGFDTVAGLGVGGYF